MTKMFLEYLLQPAMLWPTHHDTTQIYDQNVNELWPKLLQWRKAILAGRVEENASTEVCNDNKRGCQSAKRWRNATKHSRMSTAPSDCPYTFRNDMKPYGLFVYATTPGVSHLKKYLSTEGSRRPLTTSLQRQWWPTCQRTKASELLCMITDLVQLRINRWYYSVANRRRMETI